MNQIPMMWSPAQADPIVCFERVDTSERLKRKVRGAEAPSLLRCGRGSSPLRPRGEPPQHLPVVLEPADSEPRKRAESRFAAPRQAARRAHTGGESVPSGSARDSGRGRARRGIGERRRGKNLRRSSSAFRPRRTGSSWAMLSDSFGSTHRVSKSSFKTSRPRPRSALFRGAGSTSDSSVFRSTRRVSSAK